MKDRERERESDRNYEWMSERREEHFIFHYDLLGSTGNSFKSKSLNIGSSGLPTHSACLFRTWTSRFGW